MAYIAPSAWTFSSGPASPSSTCAVTSVLTFQFAPGSSSSINAAPLTPTTSFRPAHPSSTCAATSAPTFHSDQHLLAQFMLPLQRRRFHSDQFILIRLMLPWLRCLPPQWLTLVQPTPFLQLQHFLTVRPPSVKLHIQLARRHLLYLAMHRPGFQRLHHTFTATRQLCTHPTNGFAYSAPQVLQRAV